MYQWGRGRLEGLDSLEWKGDREEEAAAILGACDQGDSSNERVDRKDRRGERNTLDWSGGSPKSRRDQGGDGWRWWIEAKRGHSGGLGMRGRSEWGAGGFEHAINSRGKGSRASQVSLSIALMEDRGVWQHGHGVCGWTRRDCNILIFNLDVIHRSLYAYHIYFCILLWS